jgi:hypothetical protein
MLEWAFAAANGIFSLSEDKSRPAIFGAKEQSNLRLLPIVSLRGWPSRHSLGKNRKLLQQGRGKRVGGH